MKTCKRCFREFEEDDQYMSPAEELSEIFLQDMGVEDIKDLCPQCRGELGVMSILGFGE